MTKIDKIEVGKGGYPRPIPKKASRGKSVPPPKRISHPKGHKRK